MGTHSWEDKEQPKDSQIYRLVTWPKSDYEQLQQGLKRMVSEITRYDRAGQELGLTSSPYQEEVAYLQRMIQWGDQELAKVSGPSDVLPFPGVSVRSLRYLKAGAVLLVHDEIQRKDNVLKMYTFVPKAIVASVDERIEQFKNLSESGPLNGLKPADVFFETYDQFVRAMNEHGKFRQHLSPPDRTQAESQRATSDDSEKPFTVETKIEPVVVDEELRARCLTLFRQFSEESSQAQLDTVVREMSVMLEDRVRRVAGVTQKLEGVKLMAHVFAGDSPKIVFSEDHDTQESAHHLFRGYVGFIRNEVMHKLVKTYTPDRVAQLMGYTDYLLFLIGIASQKK
jgi:hypothetical protein